MRYFIIVVIISISSGCADTHQLIKVGNTSHKLDPLKKAYISIPRDGKYGHINYKGSGVNVSQIILMSFSKYSNTVEIGHQHLPFDKALSYAKENKYDYLVFPTILEWEDRATEWSGIPDKASIKITIIDVDSGRTMGSAIIKGKSGIATFGGDHPQDLLPKPVEKYISDMF